MNKEEIKDLSYRYVKTCHKCNGEGCKNCLFKGFIEVDKDCINDEIEVDKTIKVMNKEEELKNILAEKTLLLVSKDEVNEETRKLKSDIELLTNTINTIKGIQVLEFENDKTDLCEKPYTDLKPYC